MVFPCICNILLSSIKLNLLFVFTNMLSYKLQESIAHSFLFITLYVSNFILFIYLFISRYTPEELHAMVDLKPEKKDDD